jgi:hypothetical protein
MKYVHGLGMIEVKDEPIKKEEDDTVKKRSTKPSRVNVVRVGKSKRTN